jgi:hypothetical protein
MQDLTADAPPLREGEEMKTAARSLNRLLNRVVYCTGNLRTLWFELSPM